MSTITDFVSIPGFPKYEYSTTSKVVRTKARGRMIKPASGNFSGIAYRIPDEHNITWTLPISQLDEMVASSKFLHEVVELIPTLPYDSVLPIPEFPGYTISQNGDIFGPDMKPVPIIKKWGFACHPRRGFAVLPYPGAHVWARIDNVDTAIDAFGSIIEDPMPF